MRLVTLAEVISSPTSRKNGTASRISESMPWNICPIIDCMLIGVSMQAVEHAGHQREGDRHAHVAEDQEQGRHQQEDRAVASFHDPREIVGVFRPFEAVRQPLTSCSMQNSTISAPATGTLAV